MTKEPRLEPEDVYDDGSAEDKWINDRFADLISDFIDENKEARDAFYEYASKRYQKFLEHFDITDEEYSDTWGNRT